MPASLMAASIAAQTAAVAVNAGGTVVTVGMGCEHARLPVTSMTVREVTMAGSFRYANTVRALSSDLSEANPKPPALRRLFA